NFDIGWNAAQTVFTVRDKETWRLVSRAFDANFDFNSEKFVEYHFGALPSVEWVDDNEDGYYERVTYFDSLGRETGRYLDRNRNHRHDYAEMILQNGDTLVFTDRNEDGWWELP
ncbi:MAG: hypothetical protein AAGB22_02625, partial [Bacteroidota bacterium]